MVILRLKRHIPLFNCFRPKDDTPILDPVQKCRQGVYENFLGLADGIIEAKDPKRDYFLIREEELEKVHNGLRKIPGGDQLRTKSTVLIPPFVKSRKSGEVYPQFYWKIAAHVHNVMLQLMYTNDDTIDDKELVMWTCGGHQA